MYISLAYVHSSLSSLFCFVGESLGGKKSILAAHPPNPRSLRIKTAQLGRACIRQAISRRGECGHQPVIFLQFFPVWSSVQTQSMRWHTHLFHPQHTASYYPHCRETSSYLFFSGGFRERKQENVVIRALGLTGEAKRTADLIVFKPLCDWMFLERKGSFHGVKAGSCKSIYHLKINAWWVLSPGSLKRAEKGFPGMWLERM